MASEWFVKNNAQDLGPFSAAELKALAKNGRIHKGSLVKNGVEGPWYEATKIKGLLEGRTDLLSLKIDAPSAPATALKLISEKNINANANRKGSSKGFLERALESYRLLAPGCQLFAIIALASVFLTLVVPLLGLIVAMVFGVLVTISYFEKSGKSGLRDSTQQHTATLRSWLGFGTTRNRLGSSDLTHAAWIMIPAILLVVQSLTVVGIAALLGDLKAQSVVAAELDRKVKSVYALACDEAGVGDKRAVVSRLEEAILAHGKDGTSQLRTALESIKMVETSQLRDSLSAWSLLDLNSLRSINSVPQRLRTGDDLSDIYLLTVVRNVLPEIILKKEAMEIARLELKEIDTKAKEIAVIAKKEADLREKENKKNVKLAEVASQERRRSEQKTSLRDAVQQFRQTALAINGENKVVVDVKLDESMGIVRIYVSNIWHFAPYQIRYQNTQNLEALLKLSCLQASVKPPMFYVQDLNGNKVGGSGLIDVWVNK